MKEKLKRAFQYIFYGLQPRIIQANVSVSVHGKLLEGKRILITGGGRGLGFSIAKRCVEEGANVVIIGRNLEVLSEASKCINCKYLEFDVSAIDRISYLFDKIEELLGGKVNVLVNNAGISLHEGNIMNVTSDTFDKQLAINLKAPYFLSQEFIKRYTEAKLESGSILFVTSERGLYCDDIPYGLFKSAINSLTAGLGRRLISYGIRVNAIAPGVTVSDMTGYKADNLYRPQACGQRVYLPEEVAESAIFLLSDVSSCVSSHILACNRGNHLRCDW